MTENTKPISAYLLQVYDPDTRTWTNSYANSHTDGTYLRKETALRASKSYLANQYKCRLIEFSNTGKIENIDFNATIQRKHKRYLNSERHFVNKYDNFDNKLIHLTCIKLNTIKSNNKDLQTLLNIAKRNYVHYGIIVTLKKIGSNQPDLPNLFTINTSDTFDYLEDYLYKACYLGYRNEYYRYWDYVQELTNILSRKNFAYNIDLSYRDIKLVKLKKEEQL